MKTTSKVKSVQANGTYENQYGVDLGNGKKGFYKFEYEMEDTQIVHASHKSKNPFKVGDTVEYEITNVEYNTGKVSKPQQNDFKKSFDSKGIEVGHSINNAVNMICAGVELDSVSEYKNTEEKIYKYAKFILALSNKLKNEQN